MERTILITNDDGFDAPGLKALVEVAREFGNVVVVAPQQSWSAKSHGITIEKPIEVYPTDFFGADIVAYVTTGSPVDNLKLGVNLLIDSKIDLVLSGINHGANYAISLYYSGTVAVAMEAAFHRIPAMAVSIDSFDKNVDLIAAKNYTRQLIQYILNHPNRQQLCLNVNIPALPEDEIKGLRFCRTTKGVWQEKFEIWTHPVRKQNYYWLTGKFYNFEPEQQDTDLWALKNGYVAVVPLSVDPTNYDILQQLKNTV